MHDGTAASVRIDGEASYVDDDDFTWTSPSVYIVFNGMSATDRCGLVGSSIGRMTMSFDPRDISTVLFRRTSHVCSYTGPYDPWTTRTDNMYGITVLEPLSSQLLTFSDVAQNCSSIEGYTWYDGMPESFYELYGHPGGKLSCRDI